MEAATFVVFMPPSRCPLISTGASSISDKIRLLPGNIDDRGVIGAYYSVKILPMWIILTEVKPVNLVRYCSSCTRFKFVGTEKL